MLARRNPFWLEISRLNRLMDSFFRGIPSEERWLAEEIGFGSIPVDLSETEKEYVVRAEIPGVSKEDINVYCEANRVSISAEKKQLKRVESESYFQTESYVGQVSRTVILPGEVDASKAEATYRDGVLELRLPKLSPGLKGRQIHVR
ncbi:MAG TPA: Hsp20/alpha crystallin family protein [Firmicutes bacterium]|nr:Hsp20/alpha crystallin family protein [Bacillota bacterium]